MPYKYVASTQSGAIRRGTSELASKDAVMQDLEARGWIPVSVDVMARVSAEQRFTSLLLGTVSQVEKVLLTKHLSVMLKAGLTLIEALAILRDQASTFRLRLIMRGLHDKVERGQKFSDALAEYPQVFTPFYVNIVRAGELSGSLEGNLDHLAVQFTKEYELTSKVKSAMLYPTIVLIAAAAIGFFFATYVLPQVAALFTSLKGVELPLVTRILLKVSDIARKYTWESFIVVFGGIFGTLWFLRQKFLAPVTHYIVLHLPIVADIVKDVNNARFSLVFGTLLRSGIDIVKAIDVTSSVLGNMYFRRAMNQMLVDVQRGKPISESLAAHDDLFPKVVSRMINVGERTGKLEEVLAYLSDFYELEVENTMKNLSTILEPVLLLFIGGVALAMAFAILIPIYNFIAAIRRI
jgi:type IV pilus assembly protein PilC